MHHAIIGDTIRLDLTRAELQALIDHPNSRHDLGDALRTLAREYDLKRAGQRRPVPPR